MLSSWRFRLYLMARLPLAAFAGLRVERLDEEGCEVRLPGGWRTRNPFGSTYFAAQAMAAEMSTGAPALVLTQAQPASIALIVRELKAVYTKRVLGTATFRFGDIPGMEAAISRAAEQAEPVIYVARSVGLAEDTPAAEFEVTWSFKRRGNA